MAKLPGTYDAEALERVDPAEPRELAALQTSVRLHRIEAALLAQPRPLKSLIASAFERVRGRVPGA